MPFGCELHAPRRPRPPSHRTDVSPPVDRSPDATDAREGASLSAPVPCGFAGKPAGPALRRLGPETLAPSPGPGADLDPEAIACRQTAGLSGRGHAGRSGGAHEWLCAAGAHAADQ